MPATPPGHGRPAIGKQTEPAGTACGRI